MRYPTLIPSSRPPHSRARKPGLGGRSLPSLVPPSSSPTPTLPDGGLSARRPSRRPSPSSLPLPTPHFPLPKPHFSTILPPTMHTPSTTIPSSPSGARGQSPRPLHLPLHILLPLFSLFTFLFSLFTPAVQAAAPTVEWDLQPRILNLGEPATATISFHGTSAPSSLDLPAIDGLSIQPAGRSSNTSIVNGRTTSSITFNYAILPRRAGDFTLGPYTLAGPNGEDPIDLPAITLTVRAPDPDAPQTDILFARVEASTPTPYVQQSFDLILRIYALPTVELARDIRLAGGFPESGFVQSAFEELQTVREETSGQIYVVRRFRARFRALTAGDFDIAPILRVGVIDRSSRNARRRSSPFGDFFDDPFFNPPAATPVDLAAPPLTLHVRPVPTDNRPPDYTGAVGQYRFEADVRPRELKVGEPLTVTLRLTGRGNLSTARPPSYTDTDTYKTYEPRQSGDTPDPSSDTGTTTYEQVVIPRTTDLTALPALTFTYFDPDADTYQTATAGPFPLTVHESDTSSSALLVQIPATDTPDRARALILGTDIIYLQPAPTRWLNPTASPLPRIIGTIALFATPILALVVLFFTTRHRRHLATDIAYARRLRAPRAARNSLRRAAAALKEDPPDPRTVFAHLSSATTDYFTHRLNLPPGALTPPAILDLLARANLPPADLAHWHDFLDLSDRVRYGAAPLLTPADLKTWHQLLTTLLRQAERTHLP